MEKVVENKVFNRRPPMFSCIRQQCCKQKIGQETQVTNKLSPESSKDQIQYTTDEFKFCPHLIFKFGDLIDFSVLKD